jgi:predicted dehydrogenase
VTVSRALVVGFGSIGRRHFAVLRHLLPEATITVCRHEGGVELDPSARQVTGIDAALGTDPQIAVLANPAPFHVPVALALARQGVHLLIEKPLSHDLEQVDELIELCKRNGLVLQIGYNLRFDPGLHAVKEILADGAIGRPVSVRAEVGQYLPDWRPGVDYRRTVSARRALGGGAILELSHELDYLRWLVGDVRSVTARSGRLGDLDIDVEDCAEILLDFENGVLGSLHVDMLQRPPLRHCRIVGTEGCIAWEALTNQVSAFRASEGAWRTVFQPGPAERNALYRMQLRHFLECVDRGSAPLVDGADGRRAVELALAAKRSAREGRTVDCLP